MKLSGLRRLFLQATLVAGIAAVFGSTGVSPNGQGLILVCVSLAIVSRWEAIAARRESIVNKRMATGRLAVRLTLLPEAVLCEIEERYKMVMLPMFGPRVAGWWYVETIGRLAIHRVAMALLRWVTPAWLFEKWSKSKDGE